MNREEIEHIDKMMISAKAHDPERYGKAMYYMSKAYGIFGRLLSEVSDKMRKENKEKPE